MRLMNDKIQTLYEQALKTRECSYSPYSFMKVGAALLTHEGKIFSGCNIENASFGATLCAERVAIHKAVSECGGEIQITDLIVVTDREAPWPPCGMCLQVIAEFCQNTMTIYLANLTKIIRKGAWLEFFPHAFQKSHFKPHV